MSVSFYLKILTIFFLIFSSPVQIASSAPPNINAESAILMDATTGQILYEKIKR